MFQLCQQNIAIEEQELEKSFCLNWLISGLHYSFNVVLCYNKALKCILTAYVYNFVLMCLIIRNNDALILLVYSFKPCLHF
jgi:hypothetical protein